MHFANRGHIDRLYRVRTRHRMASWLCRNTVAIRRECERNAMHWLRMRWRDGQGAK